MPVAVKSTKRSTVFVEVVSGEYMLEEKMAAGSTARGQMRPHSSKSPPFLLVGLFVVIAILGFNYWNASTKYAFSRKQVIQLGDKYQELNLKKQGIEKRNLDLSDELSKRKTEVMQCLARNGIEATECETRIRREKDAVLEQLSQSKLEAENLKKQATDCQDVLVSVQIANSTIFILSIMNCH